MIRMSSDSKADDTVDGLLYAVGVQLAAAGNYVAGVQARARALTGSVLAPIEARESLAYGITEAIVRLQRAASVAEVLCASCRTSVHSDAFQCGKLCGYPCSESDG